MSRTLVTAVAFFALWVAVGVCAAWPERPNEVHVASTAAVLR